MSRSGNRWIIGGVTVIAGLVVLAVMESRVAPPPPGNIGRPARSISPPAPGKGRVTMIDLGATECIPCKMMAPILEELKTEYAGKADILFIDVWKNPEQAKKYGVQAIPTQIFFDRDGREVFRNVGFMDKRRIVDTLSGLGVS
jgi:thioredoxin 1